MFYARPYWFVLCSNVLALLGKFNPCQSGGYSDQFYRRIISKAILVLYLVRSLIRGKRSAIHCKITDRIWLSCLYCSFDWCPNLLRTTQASFWKPNASCYDNKSWAMWVYLMSRIDWDRTFLAAIITSWVAPITMFPCPCFHFQCRLEVLIYHHQSKALWDSI